MITWEKLTSILDYDKENGLWRWKIPIKGKMKKGWFNGTMNGEGYLQICIEGKIYLLHRLAWFYMYNNWPDKIDHRYHDLTNNKIKNLRDSCSLQNNWNKKVCGSIKIKGVCFNSKANKYQSSIRIEGITVFLGLYNTAREAGWAYDFVAQALHGQFQYKPDQDKALAE